MDRAEQKRLTRRRIVEAAGKGFRRGGFGGVGVDGMAKEAGVTSGAFYVHFRSKAEAFLASVEQGLEDLRSGIVHFQQAHEAKWWAEFVGFYLSEKRTCDLASACALQSLTSEVARGSDDDRKAYGEAVERVLQAILEGPPSAGAPRTRLRAWMALGLLIGSVTMARAVEDRESAAEIAQAAFDELTSG